LLLSLVDQSLVVAASGPEGPIRYRMLDTVREHALEQLAASADAGPVRARHATYYRAQAEARYGALLGARPGAPVSWVTGLTADGDNLSLALRWSVEHGDTEATLEFGAWLTHLWYASGAFAGSRAHLQAVLALAARAAPSGPCAQTLFTAGSLAYGRGDFPAARALQEHSLAIYRTLEQAEGIAATLSSLGVMAREQGDFARARALLREGLERYRALGHDYGVGASYVRLGEVAEALGDYAQAQAYYDASLPSWRASGQWPARVPHHLGTLALARGDLATARTRLVEALTLQCERGEGTWLHASLAALACLAAAEGEPARALRLAGAAAAPGAAGGAALQPTERQRLERWLAGARRAVGDEAAATAWAEGQAMSLEQAVAGALEAP
jgi:tetratricopeptide (TPR) repeat protein